MSTERINLGAAILLMAAAFLIGTAINNNSPGMPDCQEDEVIWWVADDTRGCVHADQFVADYAGLPVEVIEQRLPLTVVEQGLGEGIVAVALTVAGLWLLRYGYHEDFFWYDDDPEQELVDEILRKGKVQ
jgi:hypothetical protein